MNASSLISVEKDWGPVYDFSSRKMVWQLLGIESARGMTQNYIQW